VDEEWDRRNREAMAKRRQNQQQETAGAPE